MVFFMATIFGDVQYTQVMGHLTTPFSVTVEIENWNISGLDAENKPGICQVDRKIIRHRVSFDLHVVHEMPWG